MEMKIYSVSLRCIYALVICSKYFNKMTDFAALSYTFSHFKSLTFHLPEA